MGIEESIDSMLRNINTEVRCILLSVLAINDREKLVNEIREDIVHIVDRNHDTGLLCDASMYEDYKRLRTELDFLWEFGSVNRRVETTERQKRVYYSVKNHDKVCDAAMIALRIMSDNDISVSQILGYRPRGNDKRKGGISSRFRILLSFYGAVEEREDLFTRELENNVSYLSAVSRSGLGAPTFFRAMSGLVDADIVIKGGSGQNTNDGCLVVYSLSERGRKIAKEFILPLYRAILSEDPNYRIFNCSGAYPYGTEKLEADVDKVIRIYRRKLLKRYSANHQ